jgi:hypothetical protein
VTAEPQLFELHELARERGIDGYRLLSKAELLEAVGDLPPPGPTVVESAAVRDGLAVLMLRGQGGENALALETLEQLADEVERLAADESVRMIAITGSGSRIFCSGADLERVRELPGKEVTERGSRACDRIAAAGVPTVALMNGHAVGGGIDLALPVTGGSRRRARSCGSSTTSSATALRGGGAAAVAAAGCGGGAAAVCDV